MTKLQINKILDYVRKHMGESSNISVSLGPLSEKDLIALRKEYVVSGFWGYVKFERRVKALEAGR